MLRDRMDPYKAKVLCRVWAGAAMTQAHRHRVFKDVSPECECGEIQDTRHLLYECAAPQ